MKRFAWVVFACCVLPSNVFAAIFLQDDFDGYADQAAFNAVWIPIGCGAMATSCSPPSPLPGGTWSTEQAVSGTHSVKIEAPVGTPLSSDASQRNRRVFSTAAATDTPALTVGGPKVVFSFDFYDDAPTISPYRQFANLHDTTAPGTANQLVSMGLNNNQNGGASGGQFYMARILGYTVPTADPDGGPDEGISGANAFFKLNDFVVGQRSTGWHNLKVELSTDDGLSTDYAFYVDSVLAETVSNVGTAAQLRRYDNVAVGAGFSSATANAYFDNFLVETVSQIVPTAGDFNGDGKVDAADYVNWRKYLGTADPLSGNGNEEGTSAGIVDDDDYVLWRNNFGNPAPAASAALGVPEPATWLLLIAAAGLTIARRRR